MAGKYVRIMEMYAHDKAYNYYYILGASPPDDDDIKETQNRPTNLATHATTRSRVLALLKLCSCVSHLIRCW